MKKGCEGSQGGKDAKESFFLWHPSFQGKGGCQGLEFLSLASFFPREGSIARQEGRMPRQEGSMSMKEAYQGRKRVKEGRISREESCQGRKDSKEGRMSRTDVKIR